MSYAAGIAAVPLAFSLGWVAVPAYENTPGHWTAANVFAAAFATAAVSLIVLWLTGIGISVHHSGHHGGDRRGRGRGLPYTGFDMRQIGTVAVVVGMILVAMAPGLALSLPGSSPTCRCR